MSPLTAELVAAQRLLDDLDGDHRRLVEAAAGANGDDEHDVEGVSIAYERQQLDSLRTTVRARIAGLEAALGRQAAGDYGRCQSCGRAIGAERLAARPDAERCVRCARSSA